MSAKKILLIVDDETAVCHALCRLLGSRVDEVVMTANISDAESVLRSSRVTHVICDHMLGPGQPKGLDVATNWKEIYPSIQILVVLTGTSAHKSEVPQGVDFILPKSIEPLKLINHLGF